MTLRILTVLLFYTSLALAKEPSFELRAFGASKVRLKQSELLKSPDLATVTTFDPNFNGVKTFAAIRVSDILKRHKLELGATDLLVLTAADGFAAIFEAERLLNKIEGKSVAYLAVEDPQHKWAKIGDMSAGPFYLIWKHPEHSNMNEYEWPLQLVSIELKKSLAETYPRVIPQSKATTESIAQGFKVFQRTCFGCHSLNGQGPSHMGPDLNLPHSPTDYFQRDAFRSYIRNPKSLREWPAMKMPGFGPNLISEDGLENLINYLGLMAKNRPSDGPTTQRAGALFKREPNRP